MKVNRKNSKRTVAVILSAVLVLLMMPAGAFAVTVDDTCAAGSYSGTGTGYENENITVNITIDANHTISEITAETDSIAETNVIFWNSAVGVLDKIKAANGTEKVDSITGATYSSKGIIAAAEAALAKAAAEKTDNNVNGENGDITNNGTDSADKSEDGAVSTDKPSDGTSAEVPSDGSVTENPEDGTDAENPDSTVTEAPGQGAASSSFTDVSDSAYYKAAVDWAVANNITEGTSATTFGSSENCTRAQIVTFLWRAMGSPSPATTTSSFTDVNAGAYYYNAVLWAVESGITDGTSATTFAPNEQVTRAQTVTFQWRAAGKPAIENAQTAFSDVNTDAYYGNAVVWAQNAGITQGMTATEFGTANSCTRAQIVTFLYRQLGIQS